MIEYLLLFWFCAMSGILIPAPEDLALVAAGVRVHDGAMGFPLVAFVAGSGILLRDGFFYGLGRVLGDRVLQHRWIRRLVGDGGLDRARQLVARRGSVAVLISRMLVGFRATAFLVAGTMGVRPMAFLVWDLVGLVITVPAVIGLGYLFGEQAAAAVQWTLDHSWQVVPALLFVGALAWLRGAWRRRVNARESAPLPENPAVSST